MPLEIFRRDAVREALAGLIDYAGLFPPASLGMIDAVAEYRSARTGPQAWMVQRFICPADRLLELAGVLAATMTAGEEPWSLVVTARQGDLGLIADFEAEMLGGADVAAVETLLPDAPEVAAVVRIVETLHSVVFFEVPWQRPIEPALDVLVAARTTAGRALGAKVRCGGIVAEAFPTTEVLAGFLVACRDRDVPVKATAGLHHPFRHVDPVTGFTHHGLVNLLAASALAHMGAAAAQLAEVLADTDPSAFTLTVRGLTWRGHRIGAADLAAMRRDLFVGYGSCSFDEPVADLAALGILPVVV
ncbi:MAG: hypothetical protein AAB198_02560 [Actinomycetota bacterium]